MAHRKRELTVEELLTVLGNAETGDLYIDIESLGKGRYKFPAEMMPALIRTAGGGLVETRPPATSVLGTPSNPATNANANVVADARWIVEGIYSNMICDAGVANREYRVISTQGGDAEGVSTITKGIVTDSITLTASQDGVIHCTGSDVFLNDNGTVTNQCDTPCPFYLESGDFVTATSTNKETGDRLGLRLYGRIVA